MDILKSFIEEIRTIVREELQSMPQHDEDCWMNTKEICEYLGVSRSWVSHRLDKMPHIKEPLRFKKSEIDKWLNIQTQNKVEDEVHIITNTNVRSGKKKYKVV